MLYLGLIGLLFCLYAGQAAAEIVRCEDATTKDVIDLSTEPPFSYDIGGSSVKVTAGDHSFSYSANAFPTIFYAYGTHRSFGFFFGYVVDESGHVACISLPDDFDMTPERQTFFETLIVQNFPPPVFEGKAVRIYQEAFVTEQERPRYHVLRPSGDLSSVKIKLDIRGHRSGYGAFSMVISGDGTVTYIPERDNGLGTQTYHIDPAQVSIMLDLAETADFWSLRDVYRPTPSPEAASFQDEYFLHVNISVGGREKDMRIFDWGDDSGRSHAAHELLFQFADLARVELWLNVSRDTVEVLKQNGFDFRSAKGGDLLISMAKDTEAVETLLSLGAPADYVRSNGYGGDTSLLDAAILGRNAPLVDRLITNGALLTAGKPDKIKGTRALANAAANAAPEIVAKLIPYHFPLIFHEKHVWSGKTYWFDVPVITRVGENLGPASWDREGTRYYDLTTTTQQLLDAGADINSHYAGGDTLLSKAAQSGDIKFAGWLISKGASLSNIRLIPMYDDEMTVFLLEARMEPDAETLKDIIADTRQSALPKTEAWLKAHGKWPAQ